MDEAEVWKVGPADLRRMAAKTEEPERERKMLALADRMEGKEPTPATEEDAARH